MTEPPRRRPALLLALVLPAALAACGPMQIGERSERPHWRRPGPALLEPQPRLRLPDDGFRDNLAHAAPPGPRLA